MMRFLIAEDDECQSVLLTRLLRPFATNFEYTTTLRETLRASREHAFDIIILDLNLLDSSWGMTLESIRDIRAHNPKTKIIVCSGVHEPSLEEMSLKAGADVFLSKDRSLYRDSGEALYIAISVAMMNVSEADTCWPHVQALREMISVINKNKTETKASS